MTRPKIYLHWTATGYQWCQPNHYHTIVAGDGVIIRMHDYNIDLTQHTYRRNSNSIALACACMGGSDPWQMPPQPIQLEAMCKEVARIIHLWGWQEKDIAISNILTHAEAASNKDGRIMHENYGPMAWGGDGQRWDLMCLVRGGNDNGGDVLRGMISTSFANQQAGTGSNTSSPNHPLLGSRAGTMTARQATLNVLIDSNGTTWAKAGDLLAIYELPFIWDSEKRRILVGSATITPRYVEDQVSTTSGFPTFELTLQGAFAPVILVGVIHQSKAYCRVLEFADELGISTTFNPFQLHDIKGG